MDRIVQEIEAAMAEGAEAGIFATNDNVQYVTALITSKDPTAAETVRWFCRNVLVPAGSSARAIGLMWDLRHKPCGSTAHEWNLAMAYYSEIAPSHFTD